MKTIFWSLLLLSLTSFSGCNRVDSSTVQPTKSGDLVGKWKLAEPRTAYTITLDITLKSTEGNATVYQLTGLSPVNQYGADATLQASGAVVISPISATKRGGEPEAMKTETAYFNSLQKVLGAEISNGKLKLRSASDTGFSIWDMLVFEKQ